MVVFNWKRGDDSTKSKEGKERLENRIIKKKKAKGYSDRYENQGSV